MLQSSMRFLSPILILLCLVSRPALAYDSNDYTEAYNQLVRPQIKLAAGAEPIDAVNGLLAFIANPNTTDQERYLAWREIGSYYVYNPGNLSPADRERFQQQKAEPKDHLFHVYLTRYAPNLTNEEKQRRMETAFEQSIKDAPGTNIPAMVADALADFHIFSDSPLDAIVVLEKGLKTLDKTMSGPRYYLYNHLAILYTDPFQSDANIRKGIAMYHELESYQQESRGRPQSVMIFNAAVAYQFGLFDFRAALDNFGRLTPEDGDNYSEGLLNSAAAHLALGQRNEAWTTIQKYDAQHYNDPSNRMIFLNCLREMVYFELGRRDDIKACHFVSDNYYASAIDVVMTLQAVVKRPLARAEELEILSNFREYFLTKFQHRVKNSMAKTISHLELEKSRIEEERMRFAAELSEKSSQLKTMVLYSTGMLIIVLGLAMWRVWWKNRRIEALQKYIKTNILQRFLPEALIKEILQGRSRLEQEPQKKLITVLFADLVAFSATTEALGTDGIARLLNAYLKTMTDVVFAHGGTIDKFIGDGVMVIFGAPFESPPHEQVQKAVGCAEAMFAALAELNRGWQQEFRTHFELRIGINTGEAIVGSFGSEKRSDYTVIGNAVNIAARIEALAPPGLVVMSRTSAEHYDIKACTSLGYHTLKGVTGQQELFHARLPAIKALAS